MATPWGRSSARLPQPRIAEKSHDGQSHMLRSPACTQVQQCGHLALMLEERTRSKAPAWPKLALLAMSHACGQTNAQVSSGFSSLPKHNPSPPLPAQLRNCLCSLISGCPDDWQHYSSMLP